MLRCRLIETQRIRSAQGIPGNITLDAVSDVVDV
jgi:hypothetical protein